MIPRHRPPFETLALPGTGWRSLFRPNGSHDIETCWRTELDIAHAVWLPSARYGITRTVQQTLATCGSVICPVFNCGAVFHAAAECHRPLQFVDCARHSFLMDTSGPPQPESAVILSEMFGHRFSAAALQQPLVANAAVRIFDMAMAIPTRADMTRMQGADMTVLSFGLGKSLYAGWGGMALTHCPDVAQALRQQRDRDLSAAGWLSRAKWNAQLVARTMAHESLVYKQLRRLSARRVASPANVHSGFSSQSQEWRRPTTSLNATTSVDNVRKADMYINQRRRLCAEYTRQLQGHSEHIALPINTDAALSHFSVRVPQQVREPFRRQLWASGVDAGTLFPFPQLLCRADDYPQAIGASQEVLNLPLSNQLSPADVIHICDRVKLAAATLHSETTQEIRLRAA